MQDGEMRARNECSAASMEGMRSTEVEGTNARNERKSQIYHSRAAPAMRRKHSHWPAANSRSFLLQSAMCRWCCWRIAPTMDPRHWLLPWAIPLSPTTTKVVRNARDTSRQLEHDYHVTVAMETTPSSKHVTWQGVGHWPQGCRAVASVRFAKLGNRLKRGSRRLFHHIVALGRSRGSAFFLFIIIS